MNYLFFDIFNLEFTEADCALLFLHIAFSQFKLKRGEEFDAKILIKVLGAFAIFVIYLGNEQLDDLIELVTLFHLIFVI